MSDINVRFASLDALDVVIVAVTAVPVPSSELTSALWRMLDSYRQHNARALPAGPITRWDACHPYEREILARTPFVVAGTSGGPGACSACHATLRTEGDFARHYVVSDRRYLNLGSCPNQA